MGSHEAKKLPANSPHSDISILKRAANSPVQHHSLPQIHLMPLQLFFFLPFRTGSHHCSILLLHQGCSAEPRSPELAPSLLKPQEYFNTSPKQFPSSALGNPWETQDMTRCCHPHHHSAGASFPFCHLPAHFFTRSYFQASTSPSSPTTFAFTQPLWSSIPRVPSSSSKLPAAPSPPQADNHHHPLSQTILSWHLHPWLSPSEATSATGEAG